MRLIDADKFEEDLENSCSTESESHSFVNFLSYLDEQPIAFDMDRVLEELVKNKINCKNSSSIFDTQEYIRLDKAIEIIKAGGKY